MDPTEITSLISSVGFPIAVCIYLLWETEKQRETFDGLKELLNEIKTYITIGKGGE